MPSFDYKPRPNGMASHSTAHDVIETYHKYEWLAKLAKSGAPVVLTILCAVIGAVFAAGVAWDSWRSTKETVAKQGAVLAAHSQLISEMRSDVSVIRGILEGEQRRLSVPPMPVQAAPAIQTAPPAAIPRRRHIKKAEVKKGMLAQFGW